MKIVVIAWGSLVWAPKSLRVNSKWSTDGPPLPVEFLRVSKDGRLTLVVDQSAKNIPTLWAVSGCSSLDEARENLREREGTPSLEPIHYVSASGGGFGGGDILKVISAWLSTKGHAAAVWTGLPAQGPKSADQKRRPVMSNVEEVIAYLRGLDEKTRQNAKEYIERTPKQIRTEFRSKIEEELGWKARD